MEAHGCKTADKHIVMVLFCILFYESYAQQKICLKYFSLVMGLKKILAWLKLLLDKLLDFFKAINRIEMIKKMKSKYDILVETD